MKYQKSYEFTSLSGLVSILSELPETYQVWVSHVDSVYPVISIDTDTLADNEVCVSSVETYGKPEPRAMTVGTFIKELKRIAEDTTQQEESLQSALYATAAENTDPELDLQLTEPYRIEQIGVDKPMESFPGGVYLITGTAYDYC